METVTEIDTRIASLKSQTPTDKRRQRIEHLERQKAQILSADRREERKNKSRALIILGATIEKAAEETGGEALACWLRACVSRLPGAKSSVIRKAFPLVFSSGSESSRGAELPLLLRAAASQPKETKK